MRISHKYPSQNDSSNGNISNSEADQSIRRIQATTEDQYLPNVFELCTEEHQLPNIIYHCTLVRESVVITWVSVW